MEEKYNIIFNSVKRLFLFLFNGEENYISRISILCQDLRGNSKCNLSLVNFKSEELFIIYL